MRLLILCLTAMCCCSVLSGCYAYLAADNVTYLGTLGKKSLEIHSDSVKFDSVQE